MDRKLKRVVGLLVVLAAISAGTLAWSAQKNYAIGVQASDTGRYGGTDQILWLWLFLSLIGTAASGLTLIIILTRYVQSPERNRHQGRSAGSAEY